MSSFPPFLSIAASAGSGKTFQLSYRMLRLLAMEVPPRDIGAFTFSRKAAGEIFDSVVQALREAAENKEGADQASAQLKQTRGSDDFLQDLRQLLRDLPYLKVGTLDAHIARLLSVISIELGLPAEFALQEDTSAEQIRLRREILNQLFRSSALTEETADLFLQLFEEATHGKSSKQFLRPMIRFLEEHRSTYRSHPSRQAWQGPDLADVPVPLPPEMARECRDVLERELEAADLPARARSALLTLVESLAGYGPGSTWSKQIPKSKVVPWVLEGLSPVLDYGKGSYDLRGPVWDHLQQLAGHVTGIEWQKARIRTEALWGFLHLYEQRYQQMALPGGRLTFEDACVLMADFDQLTPAELAYRLDGEIKHWLLDEFQDTSRPQWQVLHPFLSEILQDPEQRRSLFFVGDVKQAIYGWRGGDAGLFEEILHQWPGIETRSMSTSYRSAQPVLDAVNRVFHDLRADEAVPEAAAVRWNQAFSLHEAAKKDLQGWAAIHQLDGEDPDPEAVVIDHLHTLPPQATVALLVRSNSEGDDWAACLRGAGFRVSREGSSPLRGHAAVETVLAGLRSTAHPADSFSRRLLQLAGVPTPGIGELTLVSEQGVHALVKKFTAHLPLGSGAAYARSRLELLETEALEFDRNHAPDLDAFLEHVDQLFLREQGSAAGIRIMTIHQCKGLGFDAVILPLKARAGFSSRTGDLIASPEQEEQDWVTLLPPKAVCLRIPELSEILQQETDRSAYETLCVLYVAMTRAKRSLFVVLPPHTSSSAVFGNWIPKRLGCADSPEPGCLAEWGSETWKDDLRPPSAVEHTPLAFPLTPGPPGVSRLEPSREQAAPHPVSREFHHGDQDGRELGSRVHDLLQQVEYTTDPLEIFLEQQNLDVEDPAVKHLQAAWKMPVLQPQEGIQELWREQKFETLLPEGWVTGIFDRVVLFEDHAWIQDYKTNRTVSPETVEHYRPQMQLYRRVLADMLRLSPDHIECQLLFTSTGQVETV